MFTINAKAAYFFIKEAGRRPNGGGKPIAWVSSLLAGDTAGASRGAVPGWAPGNVGVKTEP